MSKVVRVRIAPSPTGKFHLGTARTALFNYLFAKKNEGTFVLRIEDTDKTRSEDVHTKDIMDGMKWLGINWDEGPDTEGKFGPYLQSQRLGIYKEHADKLLEEGKAYRCFCTPGELDIERKIAQKASKPPKYSGKCRKLSKVDIEKNERAGKKYAIRFVVEPQAVTVEDLVRGDVQFDMGLVGDFPIIRSDGMPLFNLTNVIDDSQMEITHVFRGEEHLANTAKQILLAKALGYLSPEFGHLPLIFNADKTKMSKRKNPVSISEDYKAKGYLPEALVNFLALLGWSSGTDRELFSLNDLVKEFQIERVGKSASIFDGEKLLWMNGHYIRSMQLGELAERCREFITNEKILKKVDKDPEHFMQVINLIQERLKLLGETEELISFFYEDPEYDAKMLIARKSDKERTQKALELSLRAVEDLKKLTIDETEFALRNVADNNDLRAGELLWAVRVALTGEEASPGVFELLEVLGKDESVKRIKAAVKKLEK